MKVSSSLRVRIRITGGAFSSAINTNSFHSGKHEFSVPEIGRLHGDFSNSILDGVGAANVFNTTTREDIGNVDAAIDYEDATKFISGEKCRVDIEEGLIGDKRRRAIADRD